MSRGYVQLSSEERGLIQAQLSMGWSPAVIAGGLQRARSTVLRELRRNGWSPEKARLRPGGRPCLAAGYSAAAAGRRASRLRSVPRVERRLRPETPLWDRVLAELRRGLSPEQVAFTLRRMPDPVRLSHETIYTALYAMPRGELRARVMTLLRRRRLSRRSRSKGGVGEARSHFADPILLIDHRPEEVDMRLVPGHWEGDLIKGRLNQSRVGVLVERTTLYVALVRLEDGSAKTCAEGFARILNRFDSAMRKTMTYDQGREMANHRWLEQQTGIQIYFAHPHSPWERGINENTNGLLRQFLPKGEDLGRFSQQHLDDIALLLNARIRKSLHHKAPAELFLPKGAFDFVQFWQNPDNFTKVALGS